MVAIPKPDKPDYSHAKAHRPISLLETMSKLLEKAVAKRFQHDIVKHELIPTNQFGGRTHSSCLDAGLTLLHDVQRAHSIGLKVGILLFDIRGFFDHVNHGCMSSNLENLGFAPELVQWSHAFLCNHKVKLRFNSILSDDRDQPVGVPQGSLLSPVLSITYTSSLLRKMEGWNNSSLGMYVDDGILFACAEEWEEVERLLWARYTICEEWLRRSGLAIEPDKTELMFFQKPYEHNSVPAPTRLILPDPDNSTYYVVQPVENLRYLGFFINWRLKWEPHVRIMCNRTRASIKALRVLGNTVRGLSMANWRLVLNAVCLPVMTYGSQLWFRSDGTRSGWGPKGLVDMLQKVQNKMVKTVMGAFRTAPWEALLHFARMIPMCHFLEKLAYMSALHLYRLPRASQLLCRLGPDWYIPGQGDFCQVVPCPSRAVLGQCNQRPTALEALAVRVPSEGPHVDITAVAPWEVPNWEAHTSYMGVTTPHLRKDWVRELTNTSLGTSKMIIHSVAVLTPREFGTEGLLVGGAAATFSIGGSPWTGTGWTISSALTQFDADGFGLARAVEEMATYYMTEVAPPSQIYLLSSSAPAIQVVKNPRSKKAHSYALCFHTALTKFFLSHRDVQLMLVWAPRDDDLEGFGRASTMAVEASLRDPPNGLDRINLAAHQKDRACKQAFGLWAQDWRQGQSQNSSHLRATGVPLHGAAYTHALRVPPAEINHPLWCAAVDRVKDDRGRKTRAPLYTRHTTSTAFQLAVDHTFTGSYAKRFRTADPPESFRCQCSTPLRTPNHLIRECPLFTRPRLTHSIITYGRVTPFRSFFSDVTHSHHVTRTVRIGLT